MHTLHCLGVAVLCIHAAPAQRVTTLAAVGDPLPGGAPMSGAGSPFARVASDGRWLARVSELGGAVEVVLDGALWRRSGDLLPEPPGLVFDGDVDARVVAGGAPLFTHATSAAPASALLPGSFGLFRGDQLLVESRVGANVAPTPFPAPTTLDALALVDATDGARALVRALLRDATGEAHEALAIVDSTPAGDVTGWSVVAWTGAPAHPSAGAPLDALLGYATLTEGGEVLWQGRAAGASHLCVGAAAVLSPFAPSPVPGVRYGAWTEPLAADLDPQGRWVARAPLETGEWVIVAGAAVLRRDGQAVPASGGAPVRFGGFVDGVAFGRGGRLVWRGVWDEPTGPVEAVLVDDQLALRTGDITDRGERVTAIEGLEVSPNGRFALVRARLGSSEREGFLRVELAAGSPYGTATPCSTQAAGTLAAFGDTRAAANDLAFDAAQLPPQSNAVLLAARSRATLALPGASQGVLLLAPPVHVLTDRVATTSVDGCVTIAIDLTRPMLGAPPTAGETWHFQLWFRDRNPAPTSNTTSGVTVALE